MKAAPSILVLATTNAGKSREIRRALSGLHLKVISLVDIGIRKPVPEKGASFKENARAKSVFASLKSEYLTLAEDSGLEVNALGGAPGIYSARFSGRGATDEGNVRKVLRLMARVPDAKRRARFVCCLVLSLKGRTLKTATGIVRGTITRAPRGGFGFGYDPIFYYRPFRKAFAEVPLRRKNSVSHRGRAMKKMRAFLSDYLSNR